MKTKHMLAALLTTLTLVSLILSSCKSAETITP
jgi:hypothetical protein